MKFSHNVKIFRHDVSSCHKKNFVFVIIKILLNRKYFQVYTGSATKTCDKSKPCN